MRDWSKPAFTLLLGMALCFFCLNLYLSNLPVNYTYDGMVFASKVESDHFPLWDYFHPHHLLYTFLGRLLFLWGRAHGAAWDGLVTLQFFDLTTGVLGVLLLFHLLVRETDDRFVAALCATGLACTLSYWYFSTTPGVRIFATVTPLLAWYVLTWQKKLPPFFGLVVGLFHALAALGHQTNLLLVPAFLGGFWCIPGRTAWEKLRMCLYYSVSLTAGVLSAYGFVGRYVCYRKTYESWLWWVFSYFHVKAWGGHLEQAGVDRGKFAMVQAFLAKAVPTQVMVDPFTFEAAKTLFQYALWSLLAVLLLRSFHYWKGHRQALWMSLLWLVAYVPFFIWWEPWNIEFWVSSTVPCWVLIGLVASDLSSLWSQPVVHWANRLFFSGLWAGLVVLLFFYNFHGNLVRSATNAYGHKALLGALDWKVRKDDLLVLDGINTIPFYIDRYYKRDYLSLHAFLKRYEPKPADKKATPVPTSQATPTPPPDPWKDLSDLFAGVWKRHRKVWVLTEAVDEKDDWRIRLENLMKLPPGKLTEFFKSYELRPVTYQKKIYFYEVVQPSPTPSPKPSPKALHAP
ncbi:MAG TPA: hypothetical protein VHE12_11515 [bacterium]|nr:hypothetical protein [bacterium]